MKTKAITTIMLALMFVFVVPMPVSAQKPVKKRAVLIGVRR